MRLQTVPILPLAQIRTGWLTAAFQREHDHRREELYKFAISTNASYSIFRRAFEMNDLGFLAK